MMEKKITFTADFMKAGYTKTSRSMMQSCFTPGDICRDEAVVMLCIHSFAYFTEGKVAIKFKEFVCRRGEWIASYSEIGYRVGIDRHDVKTIVDWLVMLGWLRITPVGNYTRFSLTYYDNPVWIPGVSNPPDGGGGLSAVLDMYGSGNIYSGGGKN